MLTAQVEDLTARLEELKPLFPAHHKELGLFTDKMPLDPDYRYYLQKDALGEIIFCTLREAGNLIGYWVNFVGPCPHYKSTLACKMDILYIHPEQRGKAGGFLLADCVKKENLRRGVKIWWAGSKNHKEIAWFLERIGMTKAEEYYCMWLGD